MDAVAAVIGVVRAAGGNLRGRTTLQNLVYVARGATGFVDIEFRPHYCGPYSGEIAFAVDMLSAHGFLAEEVQRFGGLTSATSPSAARRSRSSGRGGS